MMKLIAAFGWCQAYTVMLEAAHLDVVFSDEVRL